MIDVIVTTRAMLLLERSLDEQEPETATWARAEIDAGRVQLRLQLADEQMRLLADVGTELRTMLDVDLRALGCHFIDGEVVLLDWDVDAPRPS